MSPLPTIPSLPPSLSFFLSSRVHAHRIPFRPSIRKITYGLGGKEREGKGKNEKEGEKKKGGRGRPSVGLSSSGPCVKYFQPELYH